MLTDQARPASNLHPLTVVLTLAGALPFLGGAIAAWLRWPLAIDPAFAVTAYGAVILSFLGGIHWSFFLHTPTPKPWIIVLSNLLALLGWIAVLSFAFAPRIALMVLASGFAVALWVDHVLWQQGFMPIRFLRLRQLITAFVVPCLLATAAA